MNQTWDLLFTLLMTERDKLEAQSSAPVYWRYDAPGRLNNVSLADVNHDGVDEFIVVADDVNVVLIGSEGRARWPAPYQTEDPIRHVLAITTAGQNAQSDQIALVSDRQLILLDEHGQELWQRPIGLMPSGP